jgi:hypothetical protein
MYSREASGRPTRKATNPRSAGNPKEMIKKHQGR